MEETDEAIDSGFVDDWSVEFEGPRALNMVLTKIATLEIASRQRMNREKTVIVPARKLTKAEEQACRAEWKKKKISYKERLLGIFIGLNATIWDQYSIPIEKIEKAIEIVDEVRKNMSLACRITVANVFLIPLLQYPNRHTFSCHRNFISTSLGFHSIS